MKTKLSPAAATVIFAAAAAVLLAAAVCWPQRFVPRTTTLNAGMFLGLAAYAVFLAWWSGTTLRAIFAPLLILAAVAVVAGSVAGFVVPAAAALSGIRSGICFSAPVMRRIIAEILTGPAGLALVCLLQPPGPFGWALSIWMFGLIQALYFIVIDLKRSPDLELTDQDRLEAARRRADALLRETKLERAFEVLQLSSRRSSDT
jgi:hypothetical protein